MWWIGHVLGLDDATGPYYLFWSGVGANLSLLGAAVVFIRRHQCHVAWCWRVGRYPAGDYRVCPRHHPELDDAPTVDDIAEHMERQ